MKEFVFTLLQAVLSVAIPVATAYLVSFLKKKSAQAQTQIENDTAKHYLDEITNAVTTAVSATSQTYVDALKKDNAFTKEAQLEALNKAKDTALSILSPAAAQFVSEVYGDLNSFLVAKIEEAVRVQKTSAGVLLPGILDTTEE
jgi:chromosomal replication initiation ATPase DnaA